MHLDRCFISMETALFQEHLMHPSIELVLTILWKR